eukprot:TRINITY_DN10844_c0_g1_i2.p1 TRINITY_DN10844_c0_g1~~TRINITY_DN10844_c0_g1_i2.p1  ORF type:complete len:128 (-),score=14.33 TRINITY_DN10844_c0_g1_i2:428-811(-)
MAIRAALVIIAGSSLAAAAPTRSKGANLRKSTANRAPEATCCDKCPGRFCSADTGACYSKMEPHYLQCPGVVEAACCDRCSGQFCSPVSGACYASQEKDYYEFCPAISAERMPTTPAEEALWPYLQV